MIRNQIRVSVGVALFSFFLQTVHASDPAAGRRLIQLSEQKRVWLEPAQIQEISRKQHLAGRCGGYMDVTDSVAQGADALFASSQGVLPLSVILKEGPTRQTEVSRLLTELSSEKISETVRHLSSYPTRYYRDPAGKESAEWLYEEYKKIGASREDVKVSLFKHSWIQSSVIARIEGKGERAKETVVIGGHLDSINHGGSDLAPGADDDASGSATVLEIFRVLVESGFQPERSIEFIAYSAEEVGMRGSQDIVLKYKKDRREVVGVMQFDMTMFPGTQNNPKITFITDYVNPALTDFSKKLADTYVKIPWTTDECGYACSDHSSWTRAGYASVFPFEAAFDDYNHSIHSENDTTSLLNSVHGLYFAQLGLAFTMEMSGD